LFREARVRGLPASPVLAAYGVFIVIATMAAAIGAMYIGGGTLAIRRQIPQLALLAVGLIAVLFAVPIMIRTFGDLGSGVINLVLSAAVLLVLLWQARRRTDRSFLRCGGPPSLTLPFGGCSSCG
jgi:hypothetical protein